MWYVVALLAGVILGLFVAALVLANTRAEELLELRRLRSLERALGGLELKVIDPVGLLFASSLAGLLDLWRNGAEGGRLELLERGNSLEGLRFVIDERLDEGVLR